MRALNTLSPGQRYTGAGRPHPLRHWWQWGRRLVSRRRTWGLAGGLLFLYIYVAGDYGLYQLYQKWRMVQHLETAIVALEEERAGLLVQRDRLERADLDLIERIARERYGMVRPGESVYRVRRTPDRETAGATPP